MPEIRVMIVDDHSIVRAGIRALIGRETDMNVVGEAIDGDDALRKVARCRPNVVLLDLSMPGRGGLDVIGPLRETWQPGKVLCFTMHDDPEWARKVHAAGGSGYLVKTAGDGELVGAIRAVSAGMKHFSLARPIWAGVDATKDPSARLAELSKREREVLHLLAHGHTQREIGDRIGVSGKTIQTYRSRIAGKLELNTRAEMVRFAMACGLLDEDLPS